jgi:hypothetical protein
MATINRRIDMKVLELIKILEKCDLEAMVVVDGYECDVDEVSGYQTDIKVCENLGAPKYCGKYYILEDGEIVSKTISAVRLHNMHNNRYQR